MACHCMKLTGQVPTLERVAVPEQEASGEQEMGGIVQSCPLQTGSRSQLQLFHVLAHPRQELTHERYPGSPQRHVPSDAASRQFYVVAQLPAQLWSSVVLALVALVVSLLFVVL